MELWGPNKQRYNPSYPFTRPFIWVTTPFITSRGPPCKNLSMPRRCQAVETADGMKCSCRRFLSVFMWGPQHWEASAIWIYDNMYVYTAPNQRPQNMHQTLQIPLKSAPSCVCFFFFWGGGGGGYYLNILYIYTHLEPKFDPVLNGGKGFSFAGFNHPKKENKHVPRISTYSGEWIHLLLLFYVSPPVSECYDHFGKELK